MQFMHGPEINRGVSCAEFFIRGAQLRVGMSHLKPGIPEPKNQKRLRIGHAWIRMDLVFCFIVGCVASLSLT
jgi:hypothetical protein